MALSEIVQTPLTPDEVRRWSFAHMANHRDIVRRVYETSTPVPPATTPPPTSLTIFPLDPLDPDNLDQWLYQHSIMHIQMDAVLGIDGYNLLDLDWRDPEQLREWISFNSDEHVIASRLLGIA